MAEKKKTTLILSSTEIIFTFILLLTVSLITFGLGLYIGMGLDKKDVTFVRQANPLECSNVTENSPPPPIQPLLPEEKKGEEKPVFTEPEMPKELPKQTISETQNTNNTTLSKNAALFVSEENMKVLATILKHGSYTIKLGVFVDTEKAILEKKKIEEAGFPSVFVCPQEDQNTLSLCLGGFTSDTDAQVFASRLQKKNIIQEFQVHKLN